MNRRALIWAVGAAGFAALGVVFAQRGTGPNNVQLTALSGADLAADPDIVLVDIRRPEEWRDTGVIEGALQITYTDADSFLEAVQPYLQDGQTLALVCRSGNRTSRAARQIAGRVGHPVLDVQGGMIRVVREGYVPVAAAR